MKLRSTESRVASLSYVERLPEVGSPIRGKLDSVRAKAARIAELRDQIRRLESEVWGDASKLDAEVENLWTAAEIAQAKSDAAA